VLGFQTQLNFLKKVMPHNKSYATQNYCLNLASKELLVFVAKGCCEFSKMVVVDIVVVVSVVIVIVVVVS